MRKCSTWRPPCVHCPVWLCTITRQFEHINARCRSRLEVSCTLVHYTPKGYNRYIKNKNLRNSKIHFYNKCQLSFFCVLSIYAPNMKFDLVPRVALHHEIITHTVNRRKQKQHLFNFNYNGRSVNDRYNKVLPYE